MNLTPTKIKRIRLNRGLTQVEFAKKLRTTQSIISRMEGGSVPPSKRIFKTLNRLNDCR